jgi:hypothetical protein
MKKIKSKTKRICWIIFTLAMLIFTVCMILRLNEDSWIKDSRGVWIKHGNPAETPAEVIEQQQIIGCAQDIYSQFKRNGMNFSSQCLGACGDYSIDIVHVPRINEDNKAENQCEEYLAGMTGSFIELDKEGKVVRIT